MSLGLRASSSEQRELQKGDLMNEKIIVRLFYASNCSGGCCGGEPGPDLAAFSDAAEKLTKKFGEDRVSFEAYASMDAKRFPFLRNAKQAPVLSVNERIISSGKKPELSEIERELKRLKVI